MTSLLSKTLCLRTRLLPARINLSLPQVYTASIWVLEVGKRLELAKEVLPLVVVICQHDLL